MDNNEYEAMNSLSEKTIFMKHKGAEYILHGLFVDYVMHIYSCEAMKDEFLALYKRMTSKSPVEARWKHSWAW
jgi:hypothetical protein